MKILAAGGAGFIGANFISAAIARGHKIINYDKLTYAGNLSSLEQFADSPSYRFIEGDICDRDLLIMTMFKHLPDAVVNFAAESHVDRSIDSPADFIRTNIDGTFSLLEACRAYHETLGDKGADFRFLHVSTDEVYGSLGPVGYFDEGSPYDPHSPYSASKASADHLVRAWHYTYGLPTMITNSANNYGPYQFPEKLIPHMIISALAGRELPIYGDGSNIRDWIYVGDHCEALFTVLAKGEPGETYCVSSENERENIYIVKKLCRILDNMSPREDGAPYERQIAFVEDRPGHDKRYAMTTSKLRRLGWAPRHDFDKGLSDTVRWYLDNRAWVDGILSGGYKLARIGTAKTQ